jgi:hypothetical protein
VPKEGESKVAPKIETNSNVADSTSNPNGSGNKVDGEAVIEVMDVEAKPAESGSVEAVDGSKDKYVHSFSIHCIIR